MPLSLVLLSGTSVKSLASAPPSPPSRHQGAFRCPKTTSAPGWSSSGPMASPRRATALAPLSWWPPLNLPCFVDVCPDLGSYSTQDPAVVWQVLSRGDSPCSCSGLLFLLNLMGSFLPLFSSSFLVPVDGSPALAHTNWPSSLASSANITMSFLHFAHAVSEQVKQDASQDRLLLYPACCQTPGTTR